MSNGYIRKEELSSFDCREKFSRDWGQGTAFPFFKTWNEAMLLWLSHVHVERPDEPLEVPVLYQTPERAFAEIAQPTVNEQVVLPIVSFTMTGSNYDATRNWGGYFFDFGTVRDGDNFRRLRKPMPWILNYNVTVWTKYQIDMDTIVYRYLSRFTPDSYLTAYGTAARMEMTNHTDTSNLEPGEPTDRMLRSDLTFKVEAWMPFPEAQVGRVEGVDIIIETTSNDSSDSTGNDENIDLGQDINIVEGDFTSDVEVYGTSTPRVPQSPQVIITEDDE